MTQINNLHKAHLNHPLRLYEGIRKDQSYRLKKRCLVI